MKTQDARWMRIRDLFEHAIELSASEREAYVSNACGDDHVLRDELRNLLAADVGQNKGPLTGAIGAAVEATTRDRRQELLGSVIGPYRLASVLGHGGAGTVYLGERVDRQYSAQVAIKVVEGAALHAEIGRRFRAERQILASLNHPHIARLIDAGETPQGYPYLVMEYVHGEPINQYCDRVNLSLDDRLKLVLKVCAAVQYAHQNLIVHRDLKPGNILVTPDGTPKLLDFGIAKLLDTSAEAAEQALTRMNDRVLTPEYASPEQILGQTITTSSDVYALGVVTYELLTGLRPYKVSSASQLELERTICIIDPAKPSAAVKQALLNANSEPPPTRNIHDIAEIRNVTPMRLRSYLDGDVDSILLRALRKEPQHRYNSIEQFASDLRRHLAREPVHARQGNWLYYAQRFTRRHAIGVATTAGVIVLITTALIAVFIQSKRIAHERDLANQEKQTSEAVAGFMVNVFAAADPFTVQDKQITATELLDKSAENIRNDLQQQPAVKARLLEAIGRSYQRQGHADQGVKLLQEALQIRRGITGKDDPNLANTLQTLGKTQLGHGDIASARESFQEARTILETIGATNTVSYADALTDLGRLEHSAGNVLLARQYLERALPLVRKAYGPQSAAVGAALTSLGYVLQWQNDYQTMEKTAREAVHIYQSTLPELHPDRILAESQLAECLFYQGHIAEAAPLIEKALADHRKVFGETSTSIAHDIQMMIELRRAQNRLLDAENFAKQLIQVRLQRHGDQNYNTAYARTTLASIQWKLSKFSEAETELRTALNVYRVSFPADHPYIASAEYFLAEVLLSSGKFEAAIAQAADTRQRLIDSHAADWRVARTENTLGEALLDQRKSNVVEARNYLEKSFGILSSQTGVDLDTVLLARARLDRLYSLSGDTTKLIALRREANAQLHRADIEEKGVAASQNSREKISDAQLSQKIAMP